MTPPSASSRLYSAVTPVFSPLEIVERNVGDVRDALKGFRKKMLENMNQDPPIEDPFLYLDANGNWNNKPTEDEHDSNDFGF